MSDIANSQPGCLGTLLGLFGIRSPEPSAETSSDAEQFPFRVRDDFLSPAEASFYRVLASTVEARWIICLKVNLSDIFFVTRPHENRGAKNRIDRKHIDFLLCHPQTLKPVLGIELDDSSHARPERQKRDELVDGVFAAANLPLLHIPARSGYNAQELAQQINDHVKSTAPEACKADTSCENMELGPKSGVERLCPKCGIPMVIRTRKQGEGVGMQFWGCTNYPKCRETAELTK